MIKTNIKRTFPHHLSNSFVTEKSSYIADYTTQTNSVRGVEVFTQTPADIACFSLKNDNEIEIRHIKFNNKSFTYRDGKLKGKPRRQCECVIFPEKSNSDSWILFLELKYSYNEYSNSNNLKTAINQLYKTRTYYYINGIFDKNNVCYLIASLPMQSEPFKNFSMTPAELQNLKNKHNTILRLTNNAEIESCENISTLYAKS
jgi:hypothetical protein